MSKILIAIATAITHNILLTAYYFMNYFKSQVWSLMGIHKNCDACIYEIRALSKIRVKEKLSVVSHEELSIIQDALCQIVTT